MKLVAKLLDYVHRAFDKEPDSFVALRLRHRSSAFRWRVAERVLYGFDGEAILFSIPLSGYTLRSLIDYLWTLDGVEVAYAAASEQLGISACALLDGEGAQAKSNGDVLLAYQSLLWMYLDAMATELVEAKARIVAMLEQMSIKTAAAEWLDEWGGYFGVPRQANEADADYANRIVVEVMRPRGNNKAMEVALKGAFGQDASVVDLRRWGPTTPVYNGTVLYNAAKTHNAVPIPIYGLFQVVIGYDLLNGGDQTQFADQVRAFIERFRDAGTHLDSLALAGSALSETFTPPSDGGNNQPVSVGLPLTETFTAPTETVPAMPMVMAAMAETFVAPGDAADLSIAYGTTYNGVRYYNGIALHRSGTVEAETV